MIKQEQITIEFLEETLKVDIENSHSEQNISAILAGFSLGSIVALLFVEPSKIVTIMFISSISSSWFFLLCTLSRTFALEGLRAELKYLKYQSSVEDSYNIVRKAKKSLNWGSYIFFIGLLSFFVVLTSASFFISVYFGIGTILLGLILFVFMLKHALLVSTEGVYFDWKLEFNQIEKRIKMKFNENKQMTFNKCFDDTWTALILAIEEIKNLKIGFQEKQTGEMYVIVDMFGSNQIPFFIEGIDENSSTITIDWNEKRKEMMRGSYPNFAKNQDMIEKIIATAIEKAK